MRLAYAARYLRRDVGKRAAHRAGVLGRNRAREMSGAAVSIEVLDRAGAVSARHRCNELPVSLGRAYDNDVILDDPFVAALHVRIERRADGVVIARDMDTRNGTHV